MILSVYLIVINILLFICMGYDKSLAHRHSFRIPEKVLFLQAFFGGSLGGILGMFCFHHKTRHLSFYILFPLFFIMNLLVYCYLRGYLF